MRAQLMTNWIGDALTFETRRRPKIDDDFLLAFITDEPTGQLAANLTPAPNIMVVEAVCTESVYATILAHPDYGAGAVLIDKAITEAEWETLRRIPYKDWPAI